MAATYTSFQREIVKFLTDYGATDIEPTMGSKHMILKFNFRGNPDIYTISRSSKEGDPHSLRNAKSELARRLGTPIRRQKPEPRSLSQLASEVDSKAALARRALEPIREANAAAAAAMSSPRLNGGETQPPFPIHYASDVMLYEDDRVGDFDVVFHTDYRAVTSDGKIQTSQRPVAAVSVSLATLLGLYDRLTPFVDAARVVEEEAVAPSPPPPPAPAQPAEPVQVVKIKRKMTPYEVVPHGIDAILRVAEQFMQTRKQITKATGLTTGGPYNKAMSEWKKTHGFGEMPSHIVTDLFQVGKNFDVIRQWARSQPKTVFADITPGEFYRRWAREGRNNPPHHSQDFGPILRKTSNGADHR